jgi:Recombinase
MIVKRRRPPPERLVIAVWHEGRRLTFPSEGEYIRWAVQHAAHEVQRSSRERGRVAKRDERDEDGALDDDDDEVQLVERVLQLRDEGLSLRQVAATLDAEGIKPRRSDRWHSSVIAAIERRARPPWCAGYGPDPERYRAS